MTKITQTVKAVCTSLTGLIGHAAAATNNSFEPNLANGQANLMGLEYAGKAVWIIDTLYALINWAAVAAMLVLVIKFLLGGWDSIETELRSRRAMMMIIIIILGLKIGLMLISLILGW